MIFLNLSLTALALKINAKGCFLIPAITFCVLVEGFRDEGCAEG